MKETNKKLIWDLPVRLFHIAIIILIPAAWYSVEISNNMDHHFWIGYALVTLISFRIIWGFIGAQHARFTSFLYSPNKIIAYAKTLFSKKPQAQSYTGHNPLGGIAVIVLLLLIAIQAYTGLFSNDEYYYFGPFSDYIDYDLTGTITEFHKFIFDVLVGFIVFHIIAVLFYWLYKKQNLIVAMITGKKDDPEDRLFPIADSKLIKGGILLGICSAVVYGISTLGG